MPDNAGEDPTRADSAPAERVSGKSAGGESGAAAGSRPRPRSRPPQRSFIKELPVLLLVALVLSFLIQTFLARVYVIPSESMEPTLLGCTNCGITNDRIMVDKITYRFSTPNPGDVVVFRGPASWSSEFTSGRSPNVLVRALQNVGAVVGLAPPNERDFVKRVIATGGQTVQCCDANGKVQVDGTSLSEPYVVNDFPFKPGVQDCGTTAMSGRCFTPVTVPDGNLWMMGDNRNNSSDSRFHVGDNARGTVPVGNVVGKARVIVVPVSRWQTIGAPQINPSTASGAGGVDPGAVPALLGVLVAAPGLSSTRRAVRSTRPGPARRR